MMPFQQQRVHRIVDWLYSIYPYAIVTLPTNATLPNVEGRLRTEQQQVGTVGGASRAMENTGKLIATMQALELHPELARLQDDAIGEWVVPRLDPGRLCCDFVVSIGGFEGVDLGRTIAKTLLAATADLPPTLLADDGPPTVNWEKHVINKKKYWREWSAPRTSLECKGSKLLTDCFMACPDVAEANEHDRLSREKERVTVFIGFGNPETSLSKLNAATREQDRLHLRPAFGYSQEVLKRTLRSDVVAATRLLLRQTSRLKPLDVAEGDNGEIEWQLPPAFLLSACARAAVENNIPRRESDDTSVRTLQSIVGDQLIGMDGTSALFGNYLLPGEDFGRLSSVGAWAAATPSAKRLCLGS